MMSPSYGSSSEQKLKIADEDGNDDEIEILDEKARRGKLIESKKIKPKNCSKNRSYSRHISDEDSNPSDEEEEERESEGSYKGLVGRDTFKRAKNGKSLARKMRKYGKVSSDEEAIDDDDDVSDVRVSEKMLWKIVKAKYLYTFKLCKICNDRLFRDTQKFVYKGELLRVSLLLCPKCVKLNIAATDLLEGTAMKAKKNKKDGGGSWKKKSW